MKRTKEVCDEEILRLFNSTDFSDFSEEGEVLISHIIIQHKNTLLLIKKKKT